jgi:hypothetical protein
LPATSSAVPESAGSERNRNASAFSSGQAASVMTIFSLSAMLRAMATISEGV